MITPRQGNGATGTVNASLTFGGVPSRAKTEEYNGTSWSTAGNLATGRDQLSGLGTQAAALGAGGEVSGTPQTITEEFNDPAYTITTVTTS